LVLKIARQKFATGKLLLSLALCRQSAPICTPPDISPQKGEKKGEFRYQKSVHSMIRKKDWFSLFQG
jgi:hypothetical protein